MDHLQKATVCAAYSLKNGGVRITLRDYNFQQREGSQLIGRNLKIELWWVFINSRCPKCSTIVLCAPPIRGKNVFNSPSIDVQTHFCGIFTSFIKHCIGFIRQCTCANNVYTQNNLRFINLWVRSPIISLEIRAVLQHVRTRFTFCSILYTATFNNIWSIQIHLLK